jgi:hypothetical protein
LGTYLSVDEYPQGKNFPTGNIRYHVMPTLDQEPVGRNNANNFDVLYIKFENINIPFELKNLIQEIVFYREPRDSKEKRSKLAQGFVSNVYLGASDYETAEFSAFESNTIRRGDPINNSFHYRRNPGFFNFRINSYFLMRGYESSIINNYKTLGSNPRRISTHNGLYYSVDTLDEIIVDDRGIRTPSTPLAFNKVLEYQPIGFPMITNLFCFSSPETLVGDGAFLLPELVKGAQLVKKAEYDTITSSLLRKSSFEYVPGGIFSSNLTYASVQGNFNIEQITRNIQQYYNEKQNINAAVYVNNGSKGKLPSLTNYDFDNTYSGKFLFLRTESNFTQNASTVGNVLDIDFPFTNPIEAVPDLVESN